MYRQSVTTIYIHTVFVCYYYSFFCYNKRQHKRLLSHHRSKVQPERRFGTTVYIYVLFIPVSTTLIVGMHEREVVDGSESLIRFSMLSLSAKTLSSRSIFFGKIPNKNRNVSGAGK